MFILKAEYLNALKCKTDVFCSSVTVIEVLPKEKKQKEEKTVILGQVTVDLLPLVNGR